MGVGGGGENNWKFLIPFWSESLKRKKKINVAAPPKLKIQNSRPTKFEQSFRCPERAYIMVIVGKLPIII